MAVVVAKSVGGRIFAKQLLIRLPKNKMFELANFV